ncbi:MAG TPA: glycerol-3-phosphate dehydrogenase [Gammaproteobacteria bacterium]|nr:glycerol-3-phosphate dehydrogenase [Gammaproteobacteria bacterium]
MPTSDIIDLFIIGGGVNGAGIAADAAGRGLKVTLCEQNDLASATSSKSSKLIHGGLRYLEYYEFRLVREALKEREVLLKKAPHIVQPLSFIMPHNAQLKPAWMLRLGLFLYDHLGKRKVLPASSAINFTQHSAGQILKKTFNRGFSYADCWVDDARLVVLNALQARQLGATILTRTRVVSGARQKDHWVMEVVNAHGQSQVIKAKVLINAAGPWVESVIHQNLKLNSKNHVTLVKGSHIVVPRLYPEDYAFILTNIDNRVIFVIPYLGKYSLIGTTDIAFQGDPAKAEISAEEIDYLLTAVNRYFEQSITREQIVWTYAGVRPLHSENTSNVSAITRDYTLELNHDAQQAPLLSVFGGKITTYRKLAEHALQDLQRFFPHATSSWTKDAPLPGGDLPNADFSSFYKQLQQQYPWLPAELAYRYARSYGTLCQRFLNNAHNLSDLGQHFGAGLYEAEVAYLMENEWAETVEDILWRRTKLGLALSPQEVELLNQHITET